jgi:hypothetical protein
MLVKGGMQAVYDGCTTPPHSAPGTIAAVLQPDTSSQRTETISRYVSCRARST